MAHISNLMTALQAEVERINELHASDTTREDLSDLLLDAIRKTLREIKMGADSDDFQELAIINFIILADDMKFDTSVILDFVTTLKNDPSSLAGEDSFEHYVVEPPKK